MLQAHSLLWHYLWVAPNLLLLLLGLLIWKRGLAAQFPAFCAFVVLSSMGHLALYAADVLPWVTGENYWRICWVALLVEAVLKFALIAEIFSHVFDAYASLARLGKVLIRAVGVVLTFAAAVAAAYAPQSSSFGIISGAHLLEQTIYFIETGLLVFIFAFSGYFRLRLAHPVFGIALGLAISACVHLATWAILANAGLPNQTRSLFDFLNMATYHVCALIWFYYLLGPQKVTAKLAIPLPENNLAVWNRELERLLQQ